MAQAFAETATSLEKRIIEQIEFYFGDVNLKSDDFLKKEMIKDNGWVELSVMLRFNRLNRITRNPKAIVAALRKSSSNLMEISDDETLIRRSNDKPIPEGWAFEQDLSERTVHFTNFPPRSSFEKIRAHCSKYGTVEGIDMKRIITKGCFVTFSTREEAANASGCDTLFTK